MVGYKHYQLEITKQNSHNMGKQVLHSYFCSFLDVFLFYDVHGSSFHILGYCKENKVKTFNDNDL